MKAKGYVRRVLITAGDYRLVATGYRTLDKYATFTLEKDDGRDSMQHRRWIQGTDWEKATKEIGLALIERERKRKR